VQNPDSEAYFLQWVYDIEGALDTAAFRRAWELVVGRHEVLRTLFVTAENGEIYQVVLRRAELDWQELDWQTVPEAERLERLAALLVADRGRGFRPSVEPPIRFMVVRLGRADYRFVWSHHHALLDGWSMAPLWGEVLAAYEALRVGQAVDLGTPVGYGRYLDWVRQQPVFEARDYWRERLQPGSAGYQLAGGLAARAPVDSLEMRLTVGETAALEAFAQRNRLTLNTVVQGAWARVLAGRSGRADVVFGVTSAGRPSGIPGVEGIVGLMLNTLPLRVRVAGDLADEDGLVAWLRGIQEQQAVQSQFEHVSLAQVAEWCGVGERPFGERPLFESFLRFQNYPMKQFLDGWQGSLRIGNSEVFDQWHYPLSVVVVPEERLVVRIGYDGGVYSEGEVEGILVEFHGSILGQDVRPARL
jgi:hypothetical protein